MCAKNQMFNRRNEKWTVNLCLIQTLLLITIEYKKCLKHINSEANEFLLNNCIKDSAYLLSESQQFFVFICSKLSTRLIFPWIPRLIFSIHVMKSYGPSRWICWDQIREVHCIYSFILRKSMFDCPLHCNALETLSNLCVEYLKLCLRTMKYLLQILYVSSKKKKTENVPIL